MEVAQGRRALERLADITLNLSKITAVFKVLLGSIESDEAVKAFLDNMSGGNIREIIEFVASLVGSPNLATEPMIRAIVEAEEYQIPVHDFWKVALKGDYNYFYPEAAFGTNIFDTISNDKSEHFLAALILAHLDHQGSHRAKDGYVASVDLITESQSLGFLVPSIEMALRILTNGKLIEASNRITFSEDEAGLGGGMPPAFRLTTRGAYHLRAWMLTFTYLDAVAVETPIFDLETWEAMRSNIRSLSLEDRFDRATLFKKYLGQIWDEMSFNVNYFNWRDLEEDMKWSFARAKPAVDSIRLSQRKNTRDA